MRVLPRLDIFSTVTVAETRLILYAIYVVRSFAVLEGVELTCPNLSYNRGWGVWFCFAAVLY